MSSRSARNSFRRTRRATVAVSAASLLTFLVTDPGSATPAGPAAAAAFNNGTGTAIALTYKVNPVFGGLSFGITAGESVAGHQNTAATGQSKAINLGVIGVTLAGEGCDGADPTLAEEQQPQPLVVSSSDKGSEQGKTANEAEGAIKMQAKATDAPWAQAITTVAPLGSEGGAEISGGRAIASSGIVAAGQREARAITEIAELSILGGVIKIGDMRWEAIQRTGKVNKPEGTFEIGSLSVGGQKVPLPSDSLKQVKVLKDTLAAVGLQITVPEYRFEQNIAFVSPMKIGIIPSDLRDSIMSAILGGVSPVRDALIDFIEQYDCGSDTDYFGNNGKTLVTILDLALGSISGAGSLNLELGGVQATTAEIRGFTGLGVLPDLPDVALPDLPVVPDVPAAPGIDTGAGTVDTPPVADAGSGSPTTPTAPIADINGDRGGALLGVGAGGLLLLLATAEADRRKMRRAQREIPLEV